MDHCRTSVLDCQRCVRDYEKAADDRQTGQKDAVVAVVFSVAAFEAFMNEATAFATGSPRQIGKPSSVRAFADIMQELEESRADLRVKFLFARVIFVGEPYDKGARPYQDFDLLVRLRNAIVHLKELDELQGVPGPGETVEPPRIIERRRDLNILAEFDKGTTPQPWRYIQTRAVARWACNSAANMAQSVLDLVPDSLFKQTLEMSYREHIKPVG